MELDLDNPDLFYGSSPALKDLNNTQVSAQKSVYTVGIYKKKTLLQGNAAEHGHKKSAISRSTGMTTYKL